LRELLDNPQRVGRAAQFPLAPFLARAAELLGDELTVLHLVGGMTYVTVAWPTIERIVGKPRARELAARRESEAIAFARRALGSNRRPRRSRR
jgi:hypothetical protein